MGKEGIYYQPNVQEEVKQAYNLLFDERDYLSFSDTSTISSIQVKISGGVQSIKTDNNTHPTGVYNANHLGNFVFLRAAFNYSGIPLGQMEAGCIDSWLCLGNSTLDKDKIITALAS